jgi:hypothetical protein
MILNGGESRVNFAFAEKMKATINRVSTPPVGQDMMEGDDEPPSSRRPVFVSPIFSAHQYHLSCSSTLPLVYKGIFASGKNPFFLCIPPFEFRPSFHFQNFLSVFSETA